MSNETLAAYKTAGADFIEAASGLTPEQENFAPAGEWSIAYIVHHLFDAETYFATRYMNILIYENPAIIMFDEELLPNALSYEGRTVAGSLAGIKGLHVALEEILGSISEDKWNRTGMHPELGPVTLTQVVAKCANHLAEHADQIRKNLQ